MASMMLDKFLTNPQKENINPNSDLDVQVTQIVEHVDAPTERKTLLDSWEGRSY